MNKKSKTIREGIEKIRLQFSIRKDRRFGGKTVNIPFNNPISWPTIYEIPNGFIKQ